MTSTGVISGNAARFRLSLFLLYRVVGPILLFLGIVIGSGFVILHLHVEQIKYFIILVSVVLATTYSYSFLIAPEFSVGRGLGPIGTVCLAFFLFVSILAAGLLITIYADKAFLSPERDDDLFLVRVLTAFLTYITQSTSFVKSAVHLIFEVHFLIFAVVFSIVDLVFLCSVPPTERRKFIRVLCVVDVPTIVAIGAVIGLVQSSILGESGEIFEAGAISFQLIAGTVSAYVLEFVP